MPSSFDPRLESALRTRISGEVHFDRGYRALYATDSSNYRQVPVGVVVPKTKEDIVQTVEICREYGVPILSRGGGTSLAGQCCNVAVVMDMSKYLNRVLRIDAKMKTAIVQPGVVLDHLRREAEKQGLTFGPDPSTHNRCTLGGMIGNNSCGVHSVMAGNTVDNVISLEILTYEGLRLTVKKTSDAEFQKITDDNGRTAALYRGLKDLRDRYGDLIRQRYPRIPRRVSGYNLDQLLPENGFNVARALVGTESTCVVVLEAVVRLVDNPAVRSLLVLGYPSIYEAGDHVVEIMSYKPIGLEAIDDVLSANMKKQQVHLLDLKLLPPGKGWLVVEFGGATKADAEAQAAALMASLRGRPGSPSMKLYDDEKEEKEVWEIREGGLGATAFVPGNPDTWEGWEDSAVPPEKLGVYLRSLHDLYKKYEYHGALYGHFGQGCVHTRINFDLVTAEGIRRFRSFLDNAADLVVSLGGSISGEHGDGQSKADLLPKMFGPDLIEAFREFKALWDPQGKMNPGKVVTPYHITQNLRLGTHYNPPAPATHFQFPADQGSFARAALRCVGVGKCRRSDGGIMCPSYRVTMDEKHSTRGRAHLLFEMLEGEIITQGWKEPAVKEALDLCLACKGCKSECPVSVDMASYKAEFLSHYYEGRLRPLHAYALGRIYEWSQLASHWPRLVNAVMHWPLIGRGLKAMAGIAVQRDIPAYAPETFRVWFERRGQRNTDRPAVLLWIDTFNNYFHPDVGRAAVTVLEAAGYQVRIPETPLCCGRPLYDYGWLEAAGKRLQHVLAELRPLIRDGLFMVGLEPSCVAVFRDELVNLFPHDQDAQRLHHQTFTLSEFLIDKTRNYQPPAMPAKALVQRHCHHQSVMTFRSDEELLKRMKIKAEILDAGCCGMAGSFGFEKDHRDISLKIGEQHLFPAVRAASRDTLILADGFSCREQIRQAAGRQPLHMAQVLELALSQQTKKGDFIMSDLEHCANCGMPKSEWTRNDGQGVKRENVLYCCEGCAQDNRCVCRDSHVTRDTKGRRPARVTQPRS